MSLISTAMPTTPSTDQIFFIVDANNFYASCERMFNPALDNRPIVVLSNNDGCVVARSAETKALGIPMGVPIFKIKHLVKQHNIAVYSSNYALYGEMSARFKNILSEFVAPDEIEPYSIDECFLNLTAHQHICDLDKLAHEMRDRLKKWIGLPSCVGIGRSKTEAKFANHIAKKNPGFDGVCNLVTMDPTIAELYYLANDASEIWGVGRQNRKRLSDLGIETALDLAQADPMLIQKRFSVVMKRTVLELQGVSCISIDDNQEPNKQIIKSRSFEKPIMNLFELERAVVMFVNMATDKLRKQGSVCGVLTVFIKTSPFHRESYVSDSARVALGQETDDRLKLIKAALHGLKHIFKENTQYKKAGIVLTAICPKNNMMYDMFLDVEKVQRRDKLNNAYDKVHNRFGNECLQVGFPKLNISAQHKSPNYFAFDSLLRVG